MIFLLPMQSTLPFHVTQVHCTALGHYPVQWSRVTHNVPWRNGEAQAAITSSPFILTHLKASRSPYFLASSSIFITRSQLHLAWTPAIPSSPYLLSYLHHSSYHRSEFLANLLHYINVRFLAGFPGSKQGAVLSNSSTPSCPPAPLHSIPVCCNHHHHFYHQSLSDPTHQVTIRIFAVGRTLTTFCDQNLTYCRERLDHFACARLTNTDLSCAYSQSRSSNHPTHLLIVHCITSLNQASALGCKPPITNYEFGIAEQEDIGHQNQTAKARPTRNGQLLREYHL